MKFLSWIGMGAPEASAENRPAPSDDFWYQPITGMSGAGVHVTPGLAMKASALYTAVKIIAEAIGSIPVQIHRRLPDNGGIELAPAHPLNDLIEYQPNAVTTAPEFWERITINALIDGMGFAVPESGPRGNVNTLRLLEPGTVRLEHDTMNRPRYRYHEPRTGRQVVYLPEDLFRVAGFGSDGITPMPIVEYAGEAIGLGLAADRYAARMFSNNLNIGVSVEHPGKLSDEAQKNLVTALMRRFSGADNAHRPLLLQEGMKVNKFGATAKDAQLLEARKWQIMEVARFLRIPSHLMGINDGATHSNVEQQSLDFVRYTLRPFIRRIEMAVRRDLIVADRVYFAMFAVDELLRGDSGTRAEYFSKALGSGGSGAWMTKNEVRRKEGLNPVPGGDGVPEDSRPQESQPPAPPPDEDDTEDEEEEDTEAAAFNAAPIEGLVRTEIGAVRRRIEQSNFDPEVFNRSVAAFYSGFKSQIAEVFIDAYGIDAELAQVWTSHAEEELRAANDPGDVLVRWQASRVEDIISAFVGEPE